MLSGTTVAPPPRHEFLMPREPHLRRAQRAVQGWDEAWVHAPLP